MRAGGWEGGVDGAGGGPGRVGAPRREATGYPSTPKSGREDSRSTGSVAFGSPLRADTADTVSALLGPGRSAGGRGAKREEMREREEGGRTDLTVRRR